MEGMKRIDHVLKYEGRTLDVYDDVMESPRGDIAHWDFVHHRKSAAAIVPVMDDGRILMVRQYRNAVDRETLEIPAGCRNSVQEEFIDCAARELEEEIGYRAGSLEHLTRVASAVGYCDEIVDVFLATDLVKSKCHWDEDEFIEFEMYTTEELKQKIFEGTIQDSKTIAGILAYEIRKTDS